MTYIVILILYGLFVSGIASYQCNCSSSDCGFEEREEMDKVLKEEAEWEEENGGE